MKKKIKIFDILGIIDILKNYNNKIDLYYTKRTFFLCILTNFFQIKKIKKLEWNFINLISPIIDNHQIDNFIYEILEDIEKKNRILKDFYHYLARYFRLNKIIGFMSIEEFLVFMKYCSLSFSNFEIDYHIERSEFNKIVEKKFKNEKNRFIFYSNPYRFFLIKDFRYLIKNFFYIFNNKDYRIFKNKSICVMDSFEMNKPDIFFCDKNFYKKIIFINREKNKLFKDSLNINHYINFKIYFYLLFLFFKNNIFFRSYKIINFLFVDYNFEKKIYLNFFEKNNIKILLTSQINQTYISSAVSAINDLGGEIIGYTMSFQEKYSSMHHIDSINYFLSFNNSKYFKFKYSKLKKIISLGYISDYKFYEKKIEADEIRKKLLSTGAKYIIGLFDQGSVKNQMWEIGHDTSRVSYKFLLKKIIDDKNFGLIIKPKKPKFLKDKLGDVYNLLVEAKKTGRCIVFDDHAKHHSKNFEDIPAKVAMASDLTIHDTLAAGTAGLESALIGTRSIYFDYLGLQKSLFDDKNLDIVYRDWNVLWKNIKKDFEKKSKTLGNWDNIIDKFDSYRDGKANLRIMNFVNKLIEEKNLN